MEKDKLEPKLRFPGFTEPWEHRKLATIATFAKGRGYSKNDLTDRGTPLILYGRLYTNYSSAIETVDTYAKPLIGSVYSKGGEVIVPASGETAEDIARASAVISKGFLLGGDLNIINPNSEIDPVFLALQLSNGYLKKELASKAQGKSVVHIHNSDLENLQIIYPSLVEQMKVSTCIRVFEHLITLHQRKEEELQKLKKGLLQKMFPKDGESVPEIRFPNFTDSWEQRKLNEVISRFIVPMRDKPKSFDGNIPWTRIEDIEGNEISRSLTNQNVSEETVEKMNLRIIPKDSLIVSASATFGVTAFVKANLITNQTFIGLVPNDNIDLGFLYYSFNAPSLRTQMKMESAGSTIFYIPQDRFKEMVISLPNIKEQYKLAKLFSDLDKLITLHHRKTEELKKLKKALLQQMFV